MKCQKTIGKLICLIAFVTIGVKIVNAGTTTLIAPDTRNGSFESYDSGTLHPSYWSIYFSSSYGVSTAASPGAVDGVAFLDGTATSTAANQLIQVRADQYLTIDPENGSCFILEYDVCGQAIDGFTMTNSVLVPQDAANHVLGILSSPVTTLTEGDDDWIHVRSVFLATDLVDWYTATKLNLRIAIFDRANTGESLSGHMDNVYFTQCDAPLSPGLNFSFYEGTWSAVPDFTTLTPDLTGHVANFSLLPALSEDTYSFLFTGYIKIPETGNYTFYLNSDDGSKLYLDESCLIDNDGLHGPLELNATTTLDAGYHQIKVGYLQRGGGQTLEVRYAGPGVSKTLVTDSMIYHEVPLLAVPEQIYPRDAYLITLANAANLQTLLDQNANVRFEAGDYRTAGPSTIELNSYDQLYGLPGTILPEIIVPAGTTGALVSNLKAARLTFTEGDAVTSGNHFSRLTGTPIDVDGASLVDNLFIGMMRCSVVVDNLESGFMRYNRFVRFNVHAASPQLVLQGNPDEGEESFGNVFFWFNFLTPGYDTTWIEYQEDLTLAGIDAESWNWYGACDDPLINTGRMGTLQLFGVQGGSSLSDDKKTALLGTNADEVKMFGVNISTSSLTDPNIIFDEDNLRSFSVLSKDYSIDDNATGAFRMDAFTQGSSAVNVGGVAVTSLTSAEQDEMRAMFANKEKTSWEPPVFSPIPNPGGANWDDDLSSKTDSTTYLQGRIDSEGIVLLDPGTYYISDSLTVGYGEGIVGSGAGDTIIIAKSSTVNMFVPGRTASGTIPFVLTDITLQGGKNGIYCNSAGNQYNGMTLSHVTFRDMTEAGIQLNSIYAWDNNVIDHVNFVNCSSGVLQVVDPTYTGGDTPTMTFMDKNFWYRCQFEDCGTALNLYARRANNLNSYYQCRFSGSTTQAAVLHANTTTMFASCLFENNAGAPSIDTTGHSFLNCEFIAGSATSLIRNGNRLDGCTFSQGGGSATILGDTTTTLQSYFGNCKSSDVSVGITGGYQFFANCDLPDSGYNLDKLVVVVKAGVETVLVSDDSDPAPSVLTGARLGYKSVP